MTVGKFVSKLVQSLPSWEMTKYYGRVAWFQLQCLKYRIQTSETWFNFMNKFMPGRLKSEADHEEKMPTDKVKKVGSKTISSETSDDATAKAAKNDLLMEKLAKFRKITNKNVQADSSRNEKDRGSENKREGSKKEEK